MLKKNVSLNKRYYDVYVTVIWLKIFMHFMYFYESVASIKERNCYIYSLIYRKSITIIKIQSTRRVVVSIEQSEEKQWIKNRHKFAREKGLTNKEFISIYNYEIFRVEYGWSFDAPTEYMYTHMQYKRDIRIYIHVYIFFFTQWRRSCVRQ